MVDASRKDTIVRVQGLGLLLAGKVFRNVRAMEAVTVEEVALRITDQSLLPVPLALLILLLRVTALLLRNSAVILFQMIRPLRSSTS